MTNPETMRCDDLERALDDYLAGLLPETEAIALELHASTCARCEARLETATRRPVDFSPAIPAGLREDTLRAVASARTASTPRVTKTVYRPWMWAGGVTTLAAAAVVFIVMRGEVPLDVRTVGSDSAGSTATGATVIDDVPARERVAARLADQEARSEFEALDAAAREIEEALAAAPSDRELRAYLSSVRARRDELARRVKAATS